MMSSFKNVSFKEFYIERHMYVKNKMYHLYIPLLSEEMARSHCNKSIWNGSYHIGHLWKIRPLLEIDFSLGIQAAILVFLATSTDLSWSSLVVTILSLTSK